MVIKINCEAKCKLANFTQYSSLGVQRGSVSLHLQCCHQHLDLMGMRANGITGHEPWNVAKVMRGLLTSEEPVSLG